MKISSHIFMLKIQNEDRYYYPVIAHDEENLVIIDTGYPLHINLIMEAAQQCGYRLENTSAVIITHQDIDHIGCVKEILEMAPKAKTMAHEEETAYIDGRLTPIKLQALDQSHPFYIKLKAGFENRRIKIDRELKDGDFLPICGGLEIIHTPGHTPGHICIYVREDKVLIAGDAMNEEGNKLTGANPQHTFDMEQADESVRKLHGFDIETILTYHGGMYKGSPKDMSL